VYESVVSFNEREVSLTKSYVWLVEGELSFEKRNLRAKKRRG
jgi:hypothetical protein